jgi:chemotaxis protein methyltransferase CheR
MTRELDRVAELVLRETGIKLQPSQYPALRSALVRLGERGDPGAFLRQAVDPVWGREAIGRLVDEVTIKETSFFRDRVQLDAISWRLLLERADGPIRIWSAACATGEEPYTLSIMACEAFGTTSPPVRILGTDISTAALEGALSGHYRERAVRAVEPALRRRYFEQAGNDFIVGDALRDLVSLAPHNLSQDPIPPLGETEFDLIICRNVLIYFDGATIERVIDGLEGALRPDGMLVLGSADALCGGARRLQQLAAPSAPPKRKVFRRPLGRRTDDAPDPLDAEASYLRGLAELEAGNAAEAERFLRRALYVDPSFGLAAFSLGRAHEAAGDVRAARRAYEQALRTIDLDDERHHHLLEQVGLGDVATACRVRLRALG